MFAKSNDMAAGLLAAAKLKLGVLRGYPYSFLGSIPECSEEIFTFRGEPASLCTYRVTLSEGKVRIFVTTSKSHLADMVHSVNWDGFIVASDGTVSEVTDEVRWEYL